MFTGCGTALVTPFTKDLAFDEAAMKRLVERQVAGGIDYLVPCGTTGESPTLTRAEHLRAIEITVETANGEIPVLAGAGGYNTHEVISLAKDIQSIGGVAGILSVTPYYNRPSQEGLYQHYAAIAAAFPGPIVLYNVPGRTGANIEVATLLRLAEIPNIVGVKEASGNIGQMAAILARAPHDFAVISGDDIVTIALIAMGARGLISVAANAIPVPMQAIVRRALAGDFLGARELQRKYFNFMECGSMESNPIPIKAAMAQLGLLELAYRLPMVPPRRETSDKIAD